MSDKIRPKQYLKRKITINQTLDLTPKQNRFIDLAMNDKTKMVFVNGPAGTSKTYLSIYCALHLLNTKLYDGIIYTRSAVESADGKLGFLPGEEEVKLAPYLRPLKDKLEDFLTPTEISYLSAEKKLFGEHVGFSRGQDWRQKIVVIDEAQNLTKKEIFTLMTRNGEGTKVFILGDPLQSDIGGKSGFKTFCELYAGEDCERNGIFNFTFTEKDIVRSELVKFIVEKMNDSGVQL